MRRRFIVLIAMLIYVVTCAIAASQRTGIASAQPAKTTPGTPPPGTAQPGTPPPGAPGARPGPPPGMPVPSFSDSFVAERDSLMNEVLKHIEGRENVAAESVFKNIKLLKGMPAGRLLRIMNLGWGHALGARCTHCHVQGHYDAEDKPQKQITRDMAAMVGSINNDLLPKIKNLRSEHPGINCTTCHRGQIKPALN